MPVASQFVCCFVGLDTFKFVDIGHAECACSLWSIISGRNDGLLIDFDTIKYY